MKISGFTMVRNATRLYYPVKASIESILPICDEFVVALGEGDADDHTEQEILSINSPKVRIIHTTWDVDKFPNGTVYAQQTDVAKQHCTGDWLFYIQSDEVIHEKYLEVIRRRCEELLVEKEVDGLLFRYRHFWGDYDHYIVSHTWYPNEVRIIRNDPEIHSWRDAQSFRRIPEFDESKYAAKEGTFKLNVANVDAHVFHYGCVRPPRLMQKKHKTSITIYHGNQVAEDFIKKEELFDYGNLGKLEKFTGKHPAVMKEWIAKFDWRDQLYPNRPLSKVRHKHEKLKYRILTFLEQKLLGGKLIGGFKNYNLLRRY